MRLYLAAIALPLALAGCGGESVDERFAIDWDDYSPAVKERIAELEDSRDCEGLQQEFDTAETNGSVDLMTYLDSAMKDAGCY